ncbi:MAG: hypothetical protein K2Z81_20130 [Cyanobacteria bacterium]|nr:hypothetical protein [Cyanobacteriota bacterium]
MSYLKCCAFAIFAQQTLRISIIVVSARAPGAMPIDIIVDTITIAANFIVSPPWMLACNIRMIDQTTDPPSQAKVPVQLNVEPTFFDSLT